MKTTANGTTAAKVKNNESMNQGNGLQCVTIRRESRDNGNAYGRKTLRNVYYRVEVPHYCDALYNHDPELQRMEREAVTAYYSEVVKLLEADGWTLQGKYGNGTAPTMTKDGQELYCHPQEISGNVNDQDTDHMAEVLAKGTTFKHYHTDLYEAIIVTTSDEDERELYAQNYDATIREKLQEVFSTPRRNLYRATGAGQWAVVRAIKLRTSRNKFGISGSEPVCGYVAEKYAEALADGWIIEDKGRDGQQIARWLNKAEAKAKMKAA